MPQPITCVCPAMNSLWQINCTPVTPLLQDTAPLQPKGLLGAPLPPQDDLLAVLEALPPLPEGLLPPLAPPHQAPPGRWPELDDSTIRAVLTPRPGELLLRLQGPCCRPAGHCG